MGSGSAIAVDATDPLKQRRRRSASSLSWPVVLAVSGAVSCAVQPEEHLGDGSDGCARSKVCARDVLCAGMRHHVALPVNDAALPPTAQARSQPGSLVGLTQWCLGTRRINHARLRGRRHITAGAAPRAGRVFMPGYPLAASLTAWPCRSLLLHTLWFEVRRLRPPTPV